MLYTLIAGFAVVMSLLVIIVQKREVEARKKALSQTTANDGAIPTTQSFPVPPQEIVASDGLSRVPAYVHRLMQSQKTATVLMISALDGQEFMSILRMNSGFIQFHFLANWPETSDRHQRARDFFTRLNITSEESQANGSRIFTFPETGKEADIAFMVKTTLIQVMDVKQNAGLKFTYEERDL